MPCSPPAAGGCLWSWVWGLGSRVCQCPWRWPRRPGADCDWKAGPPGLRGWGSDSILTAPASGVAVSNPRQPRPLLLLHGIELPVGSFRRRLRLPLTFHWCFDREADGTSSHSVGEEDSSVTLPCEVRAATVHHDVLGSLHAPFFFFIPSPLEEFHVGAFGT